MLTDRIEGKWITMFRDAFAASGIKKDSLVCIIAETQSRELNVHLCELALSALGARPFKLIAQSPRQRSSLPQRSTGSSIALEDLRPIIPGLAPCELVLDLTVEGALHSPEIHQILATGTKALHILNEHPDALERLAGDADMLELAQRSLEILRAGKVMRVTSAAGTDLTVDIESAKVASVTGVVGKSGDRGHWPGGLVATYARNDKCTINGTIVVDSGDINCTFKRYHEEPMTLRIKDDMIHAVEGDGVDASLFKSYSDSWQDRYAYACSHLGWGLNSAARWESLAMYDRRDTNSIEARIFAGNFLLGVGASHVAKRDTRNHFDISMRNTTILIDDRKVLDCGKLCIPID